MGKIEGYVVSIGTYVTKSYYISGTGDEESAVVDALEDFKEDLGNLEYEIEDIEVLNIDPEYYEDE